MAATSRTAGGIDAERLFLDSLPIVDRLVAAIGRRHRLTREEAEDFASAVRLKLLADDYEVLRAWQGKSSLGGYLAAVIQRAYIDHCNHLWGKWRPSTEARRLGPVAERLDRLMHRDGLSLDEVCALAAPEEREEMRRLAGLLPSRVKRKLTGPEALETMAAPEGSPEDQLVAAERRAAAERLEQELARAVAELPPDDRLLIRMRLHDGAKLVDLASAFGRDVRQLYRRWEGIVRTLRKVLESRGYDAAQVAWVLRDDSAAAGAGHPGPSQTTG